MDSTRFICSFIETFTSFAELYFDIRACAVFRPPTLVQQVDYDGNMSQAGDHEDNYTNGELSYDIAARNLIRSSDTRQDDLEKSAKNNDCPWSGMSLVTTFGWEPPQ